MPPYRPLKCREVRRKLKKLGFTKEKDKGGSHEKWRAMRGGKLRKVTVDCHGGEVRAMDVASIIKQAGVSKKDWARA